MKSNQFMDERSVIAGDSALLQHIVNNFDWLNEFLDTRPNQEEDVCA